jgi:hypothetical protein
VTSFLIGSGVAVNWTPGAAVTPGVLGYVVSLIYS